jgi:hypothetical protein
MKCNPKMMRPGTHRNAETSSLAAFADPINRKSVLVVLYQRIQHTSSLHGPPAGYGDGFPMDMD